MSNFRKELETLINSSSLENGSDTPDWILAEYLIDSLHAFDSAVEKRSKWYKGESYMPQNPKLDKETLSLLKNKIETNTATKEDYEKLDYFLSPFGVDNFIEILKENGINSYEEYIIERKKDIEKRNRHANGVVLGSIMGAISALEKYITNKLDFK